MNLRLPFTRPTLTDRDREVLAAAEDALAGSAAWDGATGSLRSLAAHLAAALPRPDANFAHLLEARVASAVSASFGPRPIRLSPAGRAAAVAATAFVAFVVATGVAMPALGYDPYSPLKHVVFREVGTPPVFGTPPPAVLPPPDLDWIEPAELERAAGFPVYVPGYLPSDCTPEESWYYLRPGSNSVHLQYRCVIIAEYLFGNTARPGVQAGSEEEITIGGRTAVVITCTWRRLPDSTTLCDDRFVQLWLERDDVTIMLAPARDISRQEMIKIAESLQPFSGKP